MHCLRRIIPVMIIMGLCQWAYGQEARMFKKEISLVTDNDNYTLQRRDGYYTNGFNIAFQHLARSVRSRTQKAIMRYELGQMIFNPYKYSIIDPEQMDRPFAGYLYAKLGRSRFFKNAANLQYGVMLGLLGPSSGAQSVQRKYHDLINIYEVRGWGYQLKSEPSVNFQFQYTHPLSGPLKQGQIVDLHAVGKASLGNAFTNATAGLLFRIGLIESADQSTAWNSKLHHTGPSYLHHNEAFIFFQPEVMFQAYNATLQGGLFRDDKGPVVAEINPWLYQHRVGFMYAGPAFSLTLAVIHRTREAKRMVRKENYGSIGMSFRIKN